MNVLIVEDEPKVAQRVERFCREILGTELELLHVAPTFASAAHALEQHAFDLVLLDLNLQGSDGMELVRQAAAGTFHTVVVSANTDRALDAFEVGVLDFVPKPFGKERIAAALARVREQRAAKRARMLAVRKTGKIELVAVADIAHVRASGAYSELVLESGQVELYDKTLERLMALLPESFVRIHKSHAVPIESVRALQSSEGSRYHVELEGGTTLPVGRSRVAELRERLGV